MTSSFLFPHSKVFSIIIPVYNRPEEVDELLKSLTKQTFSLPFEVMVADDGSTNTCEQIVSKYQHQLNITYYKKENTGAGHTRNDAMQKAKGDYFIIFDSDCIIPAHYLQTVHTALQKNYTHAYGGADAAHSSFSLWQKAVNYSMTSLFTTGGIRGNKKGIGKFQPRSFNMGISKKAFEKTGGFGKMKTGEDIDFTFRLWKHHFNTQFIENAYVYHKRRTSPLLFLKQTFSFGMARPYLNKVYPKTAKITYWFPSLFVIGLLFSIGMLCVGYPIFIYCYAFYATIIFVDSFIKTKNIGVAFLSVFSTLVQFLGYGIGFLFQKIRINANIT